MLKPSSLLLGLLTTGVFDALGQVPLIEWSQCYGGSHFDYVADIQACPDGGYIIAGRTFSNDGDVSGNHNPSGSQGDIWLIKLDSLGMLQWQHCYGSFSGETAAQIAVTDDHGYMVVGWTDGDDGDVNGCHGEQDGWLLRIDSTGTLLWQRCLGGSLEERLYGLVLTPDGGAVVVGRTESNDGDVSGLSGTAFDIWLARVNSMGDLLWQHCFDSGYGYDAGVAVVQGPDGTFTILSAQADNSQCSWEDLDIVLFNTDTLGQINWQTCFGGNDRDEGMSLSRTMDGGYLIGGYTLSFDHDGTGNHDTTGTYPDAFIARTDASGNHLWAKVLGGSQSDIAMDLAELPNGDLLMLGGTSSYDGDVTGNHGPDDVWLTRLNAEGDLLDGWCYGGSFHDMGVSLLVEADGEAVIGARTISFDGDLEGHTAGQLEDYWVFKLADTFMNIDTAEPPVENELVLFHDRGTLQVHCGLRACGTIAVYDAQGRVVRSMSNAGSTAQFNVEGLHPGVYTVHARGGSLAGRRVFIAP